MQFEYISMPYANNGENNMIGQFANIAVKTSTVNESNSLKLTGTIDSLRNKIIYALGKLPKRYYITIRDDCESASNSIEWAVDTSLRYLLSNRKHEVILVIKMIPKPNHRQPTPIIWGKVSMTILDYPPYQPEIKENPTPAVDFIPYQRQEPRINVGIREIGNIEFECGNNRINIRGEFDGILAKVLEYCEQNNLPHNTLMSDMNQPYSNANELYSVVSDIIYNILSAPVGATQTLNTLVAPTVMLTFTVLE